MSATQQPTRNPYGQLSEAELNPEKPSDAAQKVTGFDDEGNPIVEVSGDYQGRRFRISGIKVCGLTAHEKMEYRAAAMAEGGAP